MASGPSKTMGLAKLSWNFMGLEVSNFSSHVRLAVSNFFTKLSCSLDFFKAKKVVKYCFVYFLHELK